MEILLILVVGALCIGCFCIGAKVGQTVAKGKDIELPSVNLMQAVRERQERKQAQMEQDKFDTIMRNIEAYDGTSKGQEDVG